MYKSTQTEKVIRFHPWCLKHANKPRQLLGYVCLTFPMKSGQSKSSIKAKFKISKSFTSGDSIETSPYSPIVCTPSFPVANGEVQFSDWKIADFGRTSNGPSTTVQSSRGNLNISSMCNSVPSMHYLGNRTEDPDSKGSRGFFGGITVGGHINDFSSLKSAPDIQWNLNCRKIWENILR